MRPESWKVIREGKEHSQWVLPKGVNFDPLHGAGRDAQPDLRFVFLFWAHPMWRTCKPKDEVSICS